MRFIKNIFYFLLIAFSLVLPYYTVVVLKARDETPRIIQKVLDSEQIKLQLADFTDRQMSMLLSVQDPKFYEHKGVDMQTPVAGKATLAQVLCKLYYFDKFEEGLDKIKLMLITRFAFEPLVPKDMQMLLFINEVYLGNYGGKQIRGFEEAAHAYFGKPFKQLSEDEYIALVAMIRRPNSDNIKKHPYNHELRVTRVHKLLRSKYAPKDDSEQFQLRD